MTADERTSTGTVTPLTKKTGTGEAYFRRPEVETQILEVFSLIKEDFRKSLRISGRDDEGYVFDETLVYLLREARAKDDDELIIELYPKLNRRIWILLYSFKQKFSEHADFEDFAQTVETEIIGKVFDTDSDAADYAEINFGDFVITMAHSKFKAQIKKINRERDFVEIDRPDEDGHGFQLAADELSVEEKQILRKIFYDLPEHIREAAVLHYLEGWKVESKDKDEPTVSRRFKVSSRTIRNWLADARRILADYQGVGR